MNKAIFWDLQGTLGGDAVASIEQFAPYSFAKDALALAKRKGFINVVITNQSRIGQGTLSYDVYAREEERIIAYFNSEKTLIDAIFCCPHKNNDGCDCKKPKIGLITKCIEKYNLDIKQCYVVGDMGKNEIVMAHNAGCKGILVLTGGGQASLGEFRNTWAEHEADFIAENAYEAMRIVLELK